MPRRLAPAVYYEAMKRSCTFPECGRGSRHGDGLCDAHHRQRLLGQELRPVRRRRPQVRKDGSPCRFPGCGREQQNGGLCVGHYSQRMKGHRLSPLRTAPGASAERFWRSVDKTDGCWLWRGRVVNSGYGQASVDGVKWLAHRYSYTASVGRIDKGAVIDHLCRNKLCVRPDHLRQARHVDNVRSQGLRSNNTSGVRGVSWDRTRGRWSARVNIGGTKRFVGRFGTLEEAAQAVAAARARRYANPSLDQQP